MIHDYTRPGWDCGACGQPWPCPPAKVEIGERYPDRVALWYHMLGRLYAAAGEMPRGYDPGELHDRFMAWTRPRRRRQ
jgi:hypothetical protein